jgi:hypothetical protein
VRLLDSRILAADDGRERAGEPEGRDLALHPDAASARHESAENASPRDLVERLPRAPDEAARFSGVDGL